MHNCYLILWNEASKKWQDTGNDYFCAKTYSGKWRVSARYKFPDGNRDYEFETEQEAMAFFVNFLFSRVMGIYQGD